MGWFNNRQEVSEAERDALKLATEERAKEKALADFNASELVIQGFPAKASETWAYTSLLDGQTRADVYRKQYYRRVTAQAAVIAATQASLKPEDIAAAYTGTKQ